MQNIEVSNDEIISMLMVGKTTKEVAAELNISNRTLEGKLLRMRKKNYCRTTTQLVVKLVITKLAEEGAVNTLYYLRNKPT